jgi:hypothetical protein
MKMAVEVSKDDPASAFDEVNARLNQSSAVSRLAVVLFTTGVALLVVGFFTQ